MSVEERVLQRVCDLLSGHHPELSANLRDGRINSAMNEDEILDIVDEFVRRDETLVGWGVTANRPETREWYDVMLNVSGTLVPVNVKVTALGGADNLNCKLGIYWALTGRVPDFNNGIPWGEYFRRLSAALIPENGRDYYFLIVNKQDTSDVFFTSLKQIPVLVPNGNNLPFQCSWGRNRERCKRSETEACRYVLRQFAKSIALRAQMRQEFEEAFGDAYFEED